MVSHHVRPSAVQGVGSSQEGSSSSQSSAIAGCSKLQALLNKLTEVEADNAQVRWWLGTQGRARRGGKEEGGRKQRGGREGEEGGGEGGRHSCIWND
jgi:hypothetical protein